MNRKGQTYEPEHWAQRNEQLPRSLLDSLGKHRRDYRFCDTCRTYKPKNKRPHVKGWKCTECATVGK